MLNRGRTLAVDFTQSISRTIKTDPIVAVDYGQILEIRGLDLPTAFEVHFSKDGGTSWPAVGHTEDGVSTVDFYNDHTKTGGVVTAYIYLHETESDGETEYTIIVPIRSRPGVTPAEPTPEQEDIIAQAINALNSAVEQTAEDAAAASASASASAQSAEEAEADANRADLAWNGAVIAQNSAQASADTASQKATEASQSASTAHSEAQYAHSYAESAHTDAQSAEQSATSAQASATSAQQSATLAQQYTNTATAKASEAMQSAQSASQSAQTASASATDAQNSATQANTYATSASASATSATASEASASASATSAQESAESAQASADRAEQEADRWYEYLPVDTATGSLAHITDGAKDVPVKSLSVALEPVQDLHGQEYPYPGGGGKNLFDGVVVAGYIGANGEIGGQGHASFCHSNLIPVQGGESYIWSGNNGYPQNVKRLQCYDENRQWLSNPYYAQINTSIPYAIGGVLPANARYVALSFAREDTNVQFELGTSATAYAPYSNICPITGHTQVVVWNDPKYGGSIKWNQMVNTTNRTFTTRGVTVTVSNGKITYSGTPTDGASYIDILTVSAYPSLVDLTKFVAGHKYFINVTDTGRNPKRRVYAVLNQPYTESPNANDQLSIYACTGTPTYFMIRLWVNDSIGTAISGEAYVNCFDLTEMFGEGNEPATVSDFKALFPKDYYPYDVSYTNTCVSAVNGDPYHSITIPLGDTVYGGTLDVTNGVLTVDRAMVDMGTLAYTATTSSGVTAFRCALGAHEVSDNNQHGLTSIYPFAGTRFVAIMPDKTWMIDANGRFYVRDDSYADAYAFRSAMDGQTLVYELATPIEVSLTPQQMTTLLGINNIWSDSGDVSVDYRADVQLYIQKMIAQALNA